MQFIRKSHLNRVAALGIVVLATPEVERPPWKVDSSVYEKTVSTAVGRGFEHISGRARSTGFPDPAVPL